MLSEIWIIIQSESLSSLIFGPVHTDRQKAAHMSPPCKMHRWAQKPFLLISDTFQNWPTNRHDEYQYFRQKIYVVKNPLAAVALSRQFAFKGEELKYICLCPHSIPVNYNIAIPNLTPSEWALINTLVFTLVIVGELACTAHYISLLWQIAL